MQQCGNTAHGNSAHVNSTNPIFPAVLSDTIIQLSAIQQRAIPTIPSPMPNQQSSWPRLEQSGIAFIHLHLVSIFGNFATAPSIDEFIAIDEELTVEELTIDETTVDEV